MNPDFNHFIYQCSSSLLVPKAWVRVDQTLGLSSWIEIGSCLRRQIPHFILETNIMYI